MNHSVIVAHSLVLWGAYNGNIVQEDKDFFDMHVASVNADDELIAAYELVAKRLQFKMSVKEAKAQARNLARDYADTLGLATFLEQPIPAQ